MKVHRSPAIALDDEIETRAVEVQAVACAACSDKLGHHLVVAGLRYEALGAGDGVSSAGRLQ